MVLSTRLDLMQQLYYQYFRLIIITRLSLICLTFAIYDVKTYKVHFGMHNKIQNAGFVYSFFQTEQPSAGGIRWDKYLNQYDVPSMQHMTLVSQLNMQDEIRRGFCFLKIDGFIRLCKYLKGAAVSKLDM